MLDDGRLTNHGPYVEEFEHRIAEQLGVRHCVATCNATLALQLAIRAVDWRGEVIVPSFTFVATVHALQWQGITPVFCDIDPQTHCLDPRHVEALISPRTTGVLGVHLWGRPCDVEALTAIARTCGLQLLFDASHAFGCSYKGKMIGRFGAAEVFSFHATKFLNTFEGGAIATNDDALASRLQLMRNHGFASYDNIVTLGLNAKMSEAAAAMGLTSLDAMRDFIKANHLNYLQYESHLQGIPGLSLMTYDRDESCTYQYIVLQIDNEVTRLTRDHLYRVLWAEQVLARRYFHPGCHRMDPYRTLYPDTRMHNTCRTRNASRAGSSACPLVLP